MTITLTMMLGYIISNLIYGYIAVKVNSLGGYLPSVLVSASTYYLILIIYGVGILFGIIPVLGLLRKLLHKLLANTIFNILFVKKFGIINVY